jgi:hypothetical protein
MEVQGKIKLIGKTETFGNDFTKCNLVITTDEQYPQHIQIEFVKDKIDLLKNYKVGQDVKVSINLRGREWVNPQGETKYFNSIQGWRIEAVTTESKEQELQQKASAIVDPVFEPAGDLNTPDTDDLPF